MLILKNFLRNTVKDKSYKVMKSIFFNEDGSLKINETIANHPSYQSILADNVITEAELVNQCQLVDSLFHKVEEILTDEQQQVVEQLLVETNILNSVYKMYCFQQQSIEE